MKCDARNLALFAAVNCAVATLGNWLMVRHGLSAAAAFSGGIFLAVLLLSEQRDWWRWALVVLAVDSAVGIAIRHAGAGYAMGDTLGHIAGALATAWLIRRSCNAPFRFNTQRSVLALIVFCAVPGAAISASVEIAQAAADGQAAGVVTWMIHWTRYVLGSLIAAPLVLTLAQHHRQDISIRGARWSEVMALSGFLLFVVYVVFSSRLPLAFLLLPPMLWAGLRFGVLGTVFAITFLAIMVLHATASGRGPYVSGALSPAESLLMVQSFLVLGSAAALLLAAVTSQWREIQSELLGARDQLESQVVARTAALRENGERFRIARAGAKIIVIDWDVQRDELTYSDSPEWLRGPLPAGGKYPLFKDQVHADDRAHFIAMRDRAVDTLEGQTLQFRIVRTDGAVLHIQSFQTMLAGPDGKAARLVAIHQDITERKHTEQILAENQQRLRDSESRYRNLFVNNPLMYFTLDAAGIVRSVNPQGANQLGYAVDELVGQSVSAVFPPDLHPQVRAQLAQCLADTDRVHTWEITKVRKDGATLWVRESAIAVPGADGAPLLLIMCENVTARRQTELALRESEQRLRTLVDAIPDQVQLKDAQGRFVMINRAVQEHIGLPEAQILGKTIFELRPVHMATLLDAEDKQALAASSPVRVERRSYAHGRWREIILSPIRDSGGTVAGLVSISRDITERKQAEIEALRDSNDKLRRLSARQEALLEAERTRIAQNLHDGVGQSLNLVRLKIESSAAAGALGVTLREVVHIIEQSAVAIRTLEFELSPPVLRELGFTPALEWLAEDMRIAYGLQVDLSDDGEPKPLCELSRAVAFRAVRELLLNVSRHAGVARAHVDSQRAGGTMIITVSDQGAGFDDKAAATGLGLVSVRERIGYLGGSAVIQSTPGEGTAVTLSIPLPVSDGMAQVD